MAKLTPKQQAFADYYIELANATAAYKKAGYSVKSDNAAAVEGSKLLRNPKIKAYIDEHMEQLKSERIADQQEILEYLTSVMRGEINDEVLLVVGDEMGSGVVKHEKRSDTIARTKAAELLGKRYVMWTEKQQVEMVEPVFVDDIPKDD